MRLGGGTIRYYWYMIHDMIHDMIHTIALKLACINIAHGTHWHTHDRKESEGGGDFRFRFRFRFGFGFGARRLHVVFELLLANTR